MSWGPNRIDVFALQFDGSVGHIWWDGQIWNQWQPLVPPAGISLVGTPSAFTWGPERLDVYVSGNDSNLYHYTQTAGAFGTPESLGAPASLPPAWVTNAWTRWSRPRPRPPRGRVVTAAAAFHQRRIDPTAKAAVSWSVPTLTPADRRRPFEPGPVEHRAVRSGAAYLRYRPKSA